MKRLAPPLLTLLAVAILGIALLAITSVSNPANRNTADASAPPSAPASAAPAAPGEQTQAAAAPAVAEKAYAGRTDDRRLTVAIAVKDGRAVAYICDGRRVEAWLEGTLQGDQLALQGRDGTSITGTATEDTSSGTVTAAGRTYDYAAPAVQAPAGLYEGRADVRGVATRVGWIVEPNGNVTGLANRAGQTVAAPALDPRNPDAVTIDGVPVTVVNLDGSSEVLR